MRPLRVYSKNPFSLADDFLSHAVRPSVTFSAASQNALTDISENNGSFLVSVEAPGFDKSELDIRYDDDILTVSGKQKSPEVENDRKEEQTRRYHLQERTARNFRRSFRIPDVETEAIDASFDNGILNILLPKRKESKARKINISDGSFSGSEN
ncbi:MAG: Hsp20/alpha crystallin family protein [Deltaproteobacteria bacterium]|nr:Hsp20/alpha crystallin family protein [Deltaproteobacteria bacterium]